MHIHHYSITVSDLEDHLAFYRDKLGFEVVHEAELDGEGFSTVVGVDDAEADMVMLDANGILLEVFEYHTGAGRLRDDKQSNDTIGAHHVAFAVEDVEAEYRRLAADVEFINPVTTGATGARAAYMYDPDGNVVEILEEGTMPVSNPPE